MKTRFNKILTVITAVTFVAAFAINIQASFSDPFNGMSDEAVALTTTGVTSETTRVVEMYCKNLPSKNIGKCYEDTSGGTITLKCTKQDNNRDCYALGGTATFE